VHRDSVSGSGFTSTQNLKDQKGQLASAHSFGWF
jgi:hypothetical protein